MHIHKNARLTTQLRREEMALMVIRGQDWPPRSVFRIRPDDGLRRAMARRNALRARFFFSRSTPWCLLHGAHDHAPARFEPLHADFGNLCFRIFSR